MKLFSGIRWRLPFLAVVIGPLLAAAPVAADNCGSLSDCFSSIPPAVLAVGAIAIAILILAFLPAILTALSASFSWLMTGEFVAGTAARMAGVEAWGAAAMARAEAAAMEAEIAAGIEAAIARAEFGELLGVLARGANPASGTINCQLCVQTISSNLAGDVGAVAELSGTMRGIGGIAETFGGHLGAPTTAAGVETAMAGASHGAEGWVVVSNGSYSHIFNAVRFGGETFYVDGQIGFVGTSAAEAAAAANYGADSVFTLISFF